MMKKRILLTIMILFSIKVNSMDDCKLPDVKFFEMVEEDGISKFNFNSYVDKVSELSKDTVGMKDILGVKVDKELALGAFHGIYDNFLTQLATIGASTPHPFPEFIADLSALDEKLKSSRNTIDNAVEKFLQKIFFDNEAEINSKINRVVDLLVPTKKIIWERLHWYSWSSVKKEVVTDPTPIDPIALNASLNYLYLYALSFLIKNEQEASKFLKCMQEIYSEDLLNKLDAATKKFDEDIRLENGAKMQKLFEDIESEFEGRIKPEPLSLEQSRGALNLLSSSLTSLANLKFS